MRIKAILAAMTSLFMAATATAAEPVYGPTTVKHPEWSRDAVIYEVNVRQFTPEGTFNAFAKELPRLHDLGVDILWIMPIHPISQKNRKGELGSYYAVADYKDVNPEFGNLDDFKALVKEAHNLGMKVIIDWVPNHSGCDNPWVEQHPEYYARNAEGEMFGPYDWTDVYKFDYSNPGMREAMTDAMSFWVREADVEGFRCDVAGEVPVDFWNALRPKLENLKPDIFMLAEASQPDLEEHAFDMAYNWPMKDLFNRVAARAGQYTYVAPGADHPRVPRSAKPAEILALDKKQRSGQYPIGSYMMNMITNHDLNSWEGTEFKRLGNLADAFAVLTYTLPGMPLIYTGQEVGMDRPFEFFVKDTAPDFTPNAYTGLYKALNTLKHTRTELAAGTDGGEVVEYPTASDDILAFERVASDGARTLTIVNLGAQTAPLRFTAAAPAVTPYTRDGLTGNPVSALPATLAPGAFMVLVTD